MYLDYEKIFKEFEFTEAEKEFVTRINLPNVLEVRKSKIVSEIILGKKMEKVTEKIINSNKDLATSNEKYSKRMLIATVALFLIGAIQVGLQIFQESSNNKNSDLRKTCWKIAPSTIEGNTEKNYLACLRSHGLEK